MQVCLEGRVGRQPEAEEEGCPACAACSQTHMAHTHSHDSSSLVTPPLTPPHPLTPHSPHPTLYACRRRSAWFWFKSLPLAATCSS